MKMSFRGDAQHRNRNLEIPGLVLTHQPGLTQNFSGQELLHIGANGPRLPATICCGATDLPAVRELKQNT